MMRAMFAKSRPKSVSGNAVDSSAAANVSAISAAVENAGPSNDAYVSANTFSLMFFPMTASMSACKRSNSTNLFTPPVRSRTGAAPEPSSALTRPPSE